MPPRNEASCAMKDLMRGCAIRGARASRVLAKASRLRELPGGVARGEMHVFPEIDAGGSSSCRDDTTNTRDAYAPRNPRQAAHLGKSLLAEAVAG